MAEFIVKTQMEPWEPKLQNRHIVTFPEIYNIPDWSIKSINLPTITNTNCGNIILEIYDPIQPSIKQACMELLVEDKLNDTFELNVVILGSARDVVEKWQFTIKEIVSINFGNFDFNKDEPNTMKMELKILKYEMLF